MPRIEDLQEVVILFDEQGTPTFAYGGDSCHFLGVGVAYNLSGENSMFERCSTLFGLAKKKPLKNYQIAFSRAIEISELIPALPMQVVVVSVDLSDQELQSVIQLYKNFGDYFREKERHVRKVPIAQILYRQVLVNTIFYSVTRYIECTRAGAHFLPFMDSWSIPEADQPIILKEQIESLVKVVYKLFRRRIEFAATSLQQLTSDSKRKRLVDVVASAVSRSFLRNTHERYSRKVLEIIMRNLRNQHHDGTKEIVSFLRDFMDGVARGTIR